MKKIIKNNIFGFIVGILLCSGIVYGASLYKSEDVSYTKEGWEVDNVSEALDSLYENKGSNSVVINGVLQNGVNLTGSPSISTQNVTIPSGGTTLYLISTISGLYSAEAPYINSTNNIVNSEILQNTTSWKANYFAAGYKVIKYELDTTEEIEVTLANSYYAGTGMNCYTLVRI